MLWWISHIVKSNIIFSFCYITVWWYMCIPNAVDSSYRYRLCIFVYLDFKNALIVLIALKDCTLSASSQSARSLWRRQCANYTQISAFVSFFWIYFINVLFGESTDYLLAVYAIAGPKIYFCEIL